MGRPQKIKKYKSRSIGDQRVYRNQEIRDQLKRMIKKKEEKAGNKAANIRRTR